MRHLFAVVVSVVIIFSGTAFADDLCAEANVAVKKWVQYVNAWAQTKPAHSTSGLFTVTPHMKDGVTLWYEVSYGSSRGQEFATVIPQLAPLEGTITVLVRDQMLFLQYAYGAAGRVSCTYAVTATKEGFHAQER